MNKMSKKELAIATCRVSSDEQLLNNSLKRQREVVIDAASELGVIIPTDGWWSGSVSSKRGANLDRKDLKEMLDYCGKNKAVKYLIVDEPDRFMRSINEAMYFEVVFKQLGVTVWYASDLELNTDNMTAKLMKFMKYFVAEGSNEERQKKSIDGQTAALKEGRYTFHPKAGYKKGVETGIHLIDSVKGPLLHDCFLSIIERRKTPTQALKSLNNTEFMTGRTQPLKMDKFRTIATDPYYAGIVWMDKQVKVYNENGLHEKLITMSQHKQLKEIMNNKKKNQKGPRKNGNPKYPLSNEVTHAECESESSIARIVGFPHTNGKYNKVYEKYRCRACGLYIHKEDIHSQVKQLFKDNSIPHENLKYMTEAFDKVWKIKQGEAGREIMRLNTNLTSLKQKLGSQVEAAVDPTNASIKQEIMESISLTKQNILETENDIETLNLEEEKDKADFLEFAFDYILKMSQRFFDESLSKENRTKCKQLIFPSGFYIDSNKKVYTTEISPLYRLATKQKDSPETEKSSMVQHSRRISNSRCRC